MGYASVRGWVRVRISVSFGAGKGVGTGIAYALEPSVRGLVSG